MTLEDLVAQQRVNIGGLLGNIDSDYGAARRNAVQLTSLGLLNKKSIGQALGGGLLGYANSLQNAPGQRTAAYKGLLDLSKLQNEADKGWRENAQAKALQTLFQGVAQDADYNAVSQLGGPTNQAAKAAPQMTAQAMSDPRFMAQVMANGGDPSKIVNFLEFNRNTPEYLGRVEQEKTYGQGLGKYKSDQVRADFDVGQQGMLTRATEREKLAESYRSNLRDYNPNTGYSVDGKPASLIDLQSNAAAIREGGIANARLPSQTALAQFNDRLGFQSMPRRDGSFTPTPNPIARAALSGQGLRAQVAPQVQGQRDSLRSDMLTQELAQALQNGDQQSAAAIQQELRNMGAAPRVNVGEFRTQSPAEQKQATDLAAFDAKQFAESQDKERDAVKYLQQSERMLTLFDQGRLNTNSLAPAKMQIVGYLNALGIQSKGQESYLNDMTELRRVLDGHILSGDRLEGPQGVFDVQLYQRLAGSQTDPTAAVRMSIAYRTAEARRQKEFAQHMRDARKSNTISDARETWNAGRGNDSIWLDKSLRQYLPQENTKRGMAYRLPDGRKVLINDPDLK